jgi:hypothetical protein
MFKTNYQDEEIIHTIESTDRRSLTNKLLALVCAVLLTGGVIFGYFYIRWRHERDASQNQSQNTEAKPAPSPLANVLVDEPIPKGSQALLGGTVTNTSQQTFKSLSVELELTKRKDNTIEKRNIAIEPNELPPGQSGRYALTITSNEFKQAKVTKLLGDGNTEIPFKQGQGAKRPLEKPSPPKVKVVVIKPKSKSGEDFINSPDDPVVIK